MCITDRDHVIAAAGAGKKDFDGKPISKQLENVITDRETFCARRDEKGFVKITLDDSGEFQSQVVSTIICEGDAIGSVVMYNRDENGGMGETESKLARVAAGFLGSEKYVTDAFKVAVNGRTNVETKQECYETSVPRVFTAGDMHRGQSLVVWAIREGREAAKAVDESLMGYTSL